MSIKSLRTNQSALVIIGVLLSACIVVPVCFAGGALTIVRDEKQFAPRGSYIPERRIQQILKKVEEHRTTMKQKDTIQQENRQQESETPAPKSSKEK